MSYGLITRVPELIRANKYLSLWITNQSLLDFKDFLKTIDKRVTMVHYYQFDA